MLRIILLFLSKALVVMCSHQDYDTEESLCHLVYHGLALRIQCSSHPGLFNVMTPKAAQNALHHLSTCNNQYIQILARCNTTLSWYYQIVVTTYETGIWHLLQDETLFGIPSSSPDLLSIFNITSLPNSTIVIGKRSEQLYSGQCIIDAVQKSFEDFFVRDYHEMNLRLICKTMVTSLITALEAQQCNVSNFSQFSKNLHKDISCSFPSDYIYVPEPTCSGFSVLTPHCLFWLLLLAVFAVC